MSATEGMGRRGRTIAGKDTFFDWGKRKRASALWKEKSVLNFQGFDYTIGGKNFRGKESKEILFLKKRQRGKNGGTNGLRIKRRRGGRIIGRGLSCGAHEGVRPCSLVG